MLKPEQNQALMEVGPGTLMGDLLRRYWTPFAAAGEMDEPWCSIAMLGGYVAKPRVGRHLEMAVTRND